MDRGAWWATVHGVAQNRTRLKQLSTYYRVCVCVCVYIYISISIYPEKEMATHCSILAWRLPWTEEPGGLLSMGSHRVGCD